MTYDSWKTTDRTPEVDDREICPACDQPLDLVLWGDAIEPCRQGDRLVSAEVVPLEDGT